MDRNRPESGTGESREFPVPCSLCVRHRKVPDAFGKRDPIPPFVVKPSYFRIARTEIMSYT